MAYWLICIPYCWRRRSWAKRGFVKVCLVNKSTNYTYLLLIYRLQNSEIVINGTFRQNLHFSVKSFSVSDTHKNLYNWSVIKIKQKWLKFKRILFNTNDRKSLIGWSIIIFINYHTFNRCTLTNKYSIIGLFTTDSDLLLGHIYF